VNAAVRASLHVGFFCSQHRQLGWWHYLTIPLPQLKSSSYAGMPRGHLFWILELRKTRFKHPEDFLTLENNVE